MNKQNATKFYLKDVNDEKYKNNCENIIVKECNVDDIYKIINLLDLYMRALLGQYDCIYESIDWKLKLDDYPADKMLLRSARDVLIPEIKGRDLNTSLGVNNPKFPEKGKLAYDMIQILRYQCHMEFNNEDTMSVSSCPPYLCADYTEFPIEDTKERKNEVNSVSKIIDSFHYKDVYPNSYHQSWKVCPLVIKEFNRDNNSAIIYIHKHLLNIIYYSTVFAELLFNIDENNKKNKRHNCFNLYQAFKFLYWTFDKMSELHSEDDWKLIKEPLDIVSKNIEDHLNNF